MHPRKALVIFKFSWFFLVVAFSIAVTAQDNSPTILQPGMILVTTTYQDLQVLDPNAGDFYLSASLNVKPFYGIRDVFAHTAAQKLYFLDTTSHVNRVGAVVEFNAVTGESQRILERVNLYSLIPSPDYQRALVVYFRADLTHYPPDSPMLACVLNFQSRDCTDVDFPFGAAIRFGWVSDDSFFVLYTRQIQIADSATNFELRPLSDIPHVVDFAPIPNTDQVLISTTSESPLFIYNLGTSETLPYHLQVPQANQISSFAYLKFSPDGQYFMIYRGSSPYEVYNFQQRTLVAQLPSQYISPSTIQWMPDSQHVVGIYYEVLGEYPGEIMAYNVETGRRQVIYAFSEPTSFWIVQ